MYCIHAINQNKVVSRSPFWGIPERVIDIDDRFISVMNEKEGDIFCVFTRVLPPNSAETAPNSPTVLNSTGTAPLAEQSCYNIKR
jgi:hypothetical protein